MSKMENPRKARGIVAVRADMSNPTAILEELQKTFAAFKDEHEKELKGIKANFADVVQTEKVDKINAEISDLTKALDETNRALAALRTGGAGSDADPAKAEHAAVFNKWFRKGDRAIDADLHELEVKAALSTDSDPDGGYLVPEQMSETIDRVVGSVSVMRDVSNVMPISTDTYKKLVSMGGTGSGWVSEKESRSQTDTPTLRELVFNTMELYANPAATQKALDDGAIDIAQWLADEVAIEFSEQEGEAFISGDGVGKPRGILSYPMVANASYAWGKVGFVASGAAAAVTDADAFIDLFGALKQKYRMDASWLMSDDTMLKVRKLKDGDGTYLFKIPDSKGELPSLLGKPIRTDDFMPTVAANKFPIAFGNFNRGYLIVDRVGIRVLRDPYTNKPYVHFYTTKRVGGGISNFEAIKVMKVTT
ncbi:phage major capsid protein [Tropicimonas marinistellae]|uniref:phage major capsid protein n=1 Tax=Tropicimonas marinistellae TaxID=1739787 RepID=UPI000835D671|nr:phage major capsid protein [Tropicimonas marinistellae]